MPTFEQQQAALVLNQALSLLAQYVQAVEMMKQDGLTAVEKLYLGLLGTQLGTNLSMLFLVASPEVLAVIPRTAWQVSAVEGPVP